MLDKRVIFEKGREGRINNYISESKIPLKDISDFLPNEFIRKGLNFPSLGELEVVRHYLNLARLNYSIDTNFYPLGSCTMKYNPKINEEIAGFEEFRNIHPYQNEDSIQGALEVIYNLEKILCEITGMKKFSLQPSSGAQGELTGMLMIRKYHKVKGSKKTKVIIPDSAHGTNPASSAMCGYQVVTIKSTEEGLIDLNELNKSADSEVAAMMMTNPNTLGLFEENIIEAADIIHKNGGFMYYDGANFNPLLGIVRPFSMGFDVMHLNLHKTFSTPHGSGGPGAGAVGISKELCDFLPVPLIGENNGKFHFNYDIKHSIGKVRSFYGNFLVLLKAYVYLLLLGSDGLPDTAKNSVLNANYIKDKLEPYYDTASSKRCMHEVVLSCVKQKAKGISALDIAKRLIDYGIHPPTMYFPSIVKEALMVEPTETESKETLDYFIDAMVKINSDIESNPGIVKNSPHTTSVKRVDEVKAARFPDLYFKDDTQ